ncbi:hypothetical protein LINPERHAP2_LOCUS24463 [Linum perenne]
MLHHRRSSILPFISSKRRSLISAVQSIIITNPSHLNSRMLPNNSISILPLPTLQSIFTLWVGPSTTSLTFILERTSHFSLFTISICCLATLWRCETPSSNPMIYLSVPLDCCASSCLVIVESRLQLQQARP